MAAVGQDSFAADPDQHAAGGGDHLEEVVVRVDLRDHEAVAPAVGEGQPLHAVGVGAGQAGGRRQPTAGGRR